MAIPPNMSGIVKFSADWCGPCQQIAGTVDEICESQKLELILVDASEDQATCAAYGVKNLPTLIFLNNGKEIGKVVGADKEEIRRLAGELKNQISVPTSADARVNVR